MVFANLRARRSTGSAEKIAEGAQNRVDKITDGLGSNTPTLRGAMEQIELRTARTPEVLMAGSGSDPLYRQLHGLSKVYERMDAGIAAGHNEAILKLRELGGRLDVERDEGAKIKLLAKALGKSLGTVKEVAFDPFTIRHRTWERIVDRTVKTSVRPLYDLTRFYNEEERYQTKKARAAGESGPIIYTIGQIGPARSVDQQMRFLLRMSKNISLDQVESEFARLETNVVVSQALANAMEEISGNTTSIAAVAERFRNTYHAATGILRD